MSDSLPVNTMLTKVDAKIAIKKKNSGLPSAEYSVVKVGSKNNMQITLRSLQF